jgi:hypothetical protein
MVSHVQLIHADKHGFLAIPEGDEKGLLDAVRFMDSNECNTMMAAARSSHGKPMDEVLKSMDVSMQKLGDSARQKFGRKGEW